MTKMVKKNYCLKKSFTLLEIILYIFIFSVLGIALYQFSNISMRTNAYSQSVAEVELQGSALMLKMVTAINNAPMTEGIIYPVQGLSSSSLSIGSIESLTNPTIFFLNGTNLSMKEGKNSPTILSSNRIKVSNLKFTNLGKAGTNGVIQIKFTLGINNNGLKDFVYNRDFISAANPLLKYCSEIPCSMNSCAGTDCVAPYPTTQMTSISITNIGTNRATIGGLSTGNGQGSVTFVVVGVSPPPPPVDGVIYNCNISYDIAATSTPVNDGGIICLQNSADNVVYAIGLQRLTTYYFAVYEYNIVNGYYYYNKTRGVNNSKKIVIPRA